MSSFTNNINYSLNITGGNLSVSGSSTVGNLTAQGMTVGNINLTGALFQNGESYASSQWTTTAGNVSYTSGTVVATNLEATNVSAGAFVGSSATLSGALSASSLAATSATVGQLAATNVSAGAFVGSSATLSGALRAGSGTIGSIFASNTNIGIGTTSPGSYLDVRSGNWGAVRAIPGNDGSESAFGFLGRADGIADSSGGTVGNWLMGINLTGYGPGFNIRSNALGTQPIFTIATGGNVGIGTSSPETKLTIAATRTNITSGVLTLSPDGYKTFMGNLPGNDGNRFYINSRGDVGLYGSIELCTNDVSRVIISDTGNVGIGTGSPSQKLHIKEGNIIIESAGPTDELVSNIIFKESGYNDTFFIGNDFAGSGNNNLLMIGSSSSGSVGVAGAKVAINMSGNIGIGTTSPQSSLHVAGSIANAPTGNGIQMGMDSFTYAQIQLNSTMGSYIDFSTSGTDSLGRIVYYNAQKLFQIFNNNIPTMTFSSSGNVGIGTTSPSFTLDVNGTFEASNANGAMLFASSGNVGVGTSSPSSILDIVGNTVDTYINVRSSANNRIAGIKFLESGNNFGGGIYYDGSNDRLFMGHYVNSTTSNLAFTLVTSGNVGIGTTSPVSRLNVQADGTGTWATDATIGQLILSGNTDPLKRLALMIDTTKNIGVVQAAKALSGAYPLCLNPGGGSVGIGTTSPSTGFGGTINNVNLALRNGTPGSVGGTSTLLIGGDNNHYCSITGVHPGGGLTYLSFGTCTSNVNPTEKMRITSDGQVISYNTLNIEKESVGWKLNTYWDGDAQALSFEYYAGPQNTGGYTGYGSKGRIDPFWNSANINFTGQHRCIIKDNVINKLNLNDYIGLIVSASNNDYVNMPNSPNTLTRGKNAITISESLPVVSLSEKNCDKTCFGVISDIEDQEERTYNQGSWVSTSYKETGDNRLYINSVGEGGIWVSNKNGPLESGDFITTSSIPGYGMLQTSDSLTNYTVAKITMDCDFSNPLKSKYKIKKDVDGNNILDENDNIIWEYELNELNEIVYENSYDLRYLQENGTIITEEEYNTKLQNGESVFIAAFVGCTYHCG